MVLSFKQVSEGSSGLRGWSPQQIGAGLEIPPPASQASSNHHQQQRRERPTPLKCPRCDSTNTKFCYYNNYSRLQPRHFCRACKRHWTEGGTLRNVPVGGGRKAKRPRTSNATAVAAGVSKDKSTMSSAMFPDILRQLLLQTPPPPPPSEHSYGNDSSSGGLLGSRLPPYQFLPEFHGTRPGIVSSFDGASSASPPSLSSASGGNDSGINLMDGTSTTNTWPWEPAALPDNYWSCWDGMEDFAAPSSSQ